MSHAYFIPSFVKIGSPVSLIIVSAFTSLRIVWKTDIQAEYDILQNMEIIIIIITFIIIIIISSPEPLGSQGEL